MLVLKYIPALVGSLQVTYVFSTTFRLRKRVRSEEASLILKDIPASRKWDLLMLKDIPASSANFLYFPKLPPALRHFRLAGTLWKTPHAANRANSFLLTFICIT
jgi:hypothetical protein